MVKKTKPPKRIPVYVKVNGKRVPLNEFLGPAKTKKTREVKPGDKDIKKAVKKE